MVSSTTRLSIRIAFIFLLLIVAFYIGRPLYWKLSETIHDIRVNKTTVKEGFSQFVIEARKSVAWLHEDISDGRAGITASRRFLLQFVDSKPSRRR